MDNFTWHNPTRIHFGRGQIARIADELPQDARILLLAGGSSIRGNGVFEQVKDALGERVVHEHWGVEANPDFDTLMPAIDLCRKERIDYVLAVGGGSVIDGAKFVCAATPFDGDPWTILSQRAELHQALPLGTVLTLPETTFSLPARQIANGVADAFTHVLEQYLTFPVEAAVQDGFAEALLRILVEKGPLTVAEPDNYGLRADICWTATWALNGSLGMGVPQDWASHMIGHELTAIHGIDHARTLAVVMPALIHCGDDEKAAKLAQMGERVWGIRRGTPQARAAATLELVRGFYHSLELPTTLADYQIEPGPLGEEIAGRLEKRGMLPLGERGTIDAARIRDILNAAA